MPTKKILLVANTAWNLWNYRYALIQTLQQAGYEIVLAAPEDRFAPLLNKPFRVLKHLSRRNFAVIQNLRALLELYRLFRQAHPDMVLLYTIKPNILGNIAARFASIPTISIVEGLGYSGSFAARWRWLAAPLYRLALHHARRVVFLNHDDAREFLEQKIISPAQVQIIPGPGVDTEHFRPVHRPSLPAVTFLFCGRLLSEKGIREYIEAAEHLRQLGAPAIFRVLGGPDPGNPTSINTPEINAWKQAGLVEFLGMTDDVRPYLAAADVLVLPTYYREGVPRSILEGMAMGKIIVTTDTPGCRDTVEDGHTGFLIPIRRPDILAQTMQYLLNLSPETRFAMGKSGREKVVREFSDAVILPQYLSLLQVVFSEKSNPS